MALVQYLARLDPDEQEVNARQYLARARKRLRRIEDGVAPANDASYARALAA